MRAFTAKYRGTCAGCGGEIKPGATINGTKGAYYHGTGNGSGCAPSGDPAADREYLQGVADANRYLSDKAIYGAELAEAWELEREMDPRHWDW